MRLHYLCVPCGREITEYEGAVYCSNCKEQMERGVFCILCGTDKATHDDTCLHCLAVEVIDRVTSIDDLPESWRKEVSDEVCAEVAYREKCRKERQEKAREEFISMLRMVGVAYEYGKIELPPIEGGWLMRRQA